MSAPVLLGPGGTPLRLGSALGGGGEGTVYALPGSSDVAKIYARPPSPERVAKLDALVRLATPELRTIAAWPHELVRDARGNAAGFVMPRIEGRLTLASAMNPGSRKAKLPQATWAWLVHTARNLAAAVESVHRAGAVIGDVNDANFLVGADTFVRLIDVDSFQVREGARLFTCDVGMPIYQPPELFGRGYTGLERTPDHDRFGLAVLIFQLVFMGRHPWAGLWNGPEYAFESGELIARLPFAFGREAPAVGFRPPPNTVRMEWLPEATGALFERAFARTAAPRPSGAEWAAGLAAFEAALERCAVSPLHRFVAARGPCRWCELERQGLFLFVAPLGAATAAGGLLDVAALERLLHELPPLAYVTPPEPRAVAVEGEPLARPLRRQRRVWLAGAAAGIAVCAVATQHLGFSPLDLAVYAAVLAALLPTRAATGAVKRERRAAMREARRRYDDAARQWPALADLRELDGRRAQLLGLAAAYRGLPAKYTAERARIEADKPRQQMRAFLDTYLIEDTVIPGIGKRRKATLRSFGIESALDVEEKLDRIAIPGFGSGRRGTLKSWVFVLKRMFRYDPGRPVDAAVLEDLRLRESRERTDLERELRTGPQALVAAVRQRLTLRDELGRELLVLAELAAKARADYAALRRL
jgi:DNA-binding helix-hairpin-helix protein with protein kinase domain